METSLIFLLIVIVIALLFEYINGFHDTANAIATIVSTKVLTARQAILFAGILNFLGAFAGTHVAKTIGSGLVDTGHVTQLVILCALIGAIIWNLITWYYGIPSSSSHALVGGLLGAAIANAGSSTVKFDGVMSKVVYPMFTSPVMGICIGFLCMLALMWVARKSIPDKMNKRFRKLQLVSSGFMAFSHGTNDAQKTMGIITLALFSFGTIESVEVPIWVVFVCALTMGLGTMAGGWKIIQTMGTKVIKLKPIHGFAAETSASAIILGASYFGIPVSTTHIIATSIMGVGSVKGLNAVKWGLVGKIIQAWFLTIPICMLISGSCFYVLSRIVGQ